MIMMQPTSLNYKLAKWAILLSQHDEVRTPKNVKNQFVADFIADYPMLTSSRL